MSAMIVVQIVGSLVWMAKSPGASDGVDTATSREFRYSNRCGPIAGFVALRRLGCEATLEDAIAGCRTVGDGPTSLQHLAEYLERNPVVTCQGVSMSSEQLVAYAASNDHAVILLLQTGADVGHVVCVTGGNESGVTVVDYPVVQRRLELSELNQVWDGRALLVSRDHVWDILQHMHWFLPAMVTVWATMRFARRCKR